MHYLYSFFYFIRELHIENITRTTISLWKEREIFAFERDEESDIFTSGTERMAITSEGILFIVLR